MMTETAVDANGFPAVDKHLFVGGPKHGQRIEVIAKDLTHRVMTPPAPPSLGGYDVHTYTRREVTLPGYARPVFIHESIPNSETAQQMLMSALYVDFVKGGRKVTDGSSGG
jgi:hypothetical protein